MAEKKCEPKQNENGTYVTICNCEYGYFSHGG